MDKNLNRRGFTLIELSIVLVIIGLIVGGVLAGQELIKAAEVRATITQIERYNTAANTFRGKYSFLPGDIKNPEAASFGFATRGQYAGEGDGNGTIEGIYSNAPSQNNGYYPGPGGEVAMFWADLSVAHLVDGSFTTATPTTVPFTTFTASSTPSLDAFFPRAKVGTNWIYIWSKAGVNYFGMSYINGMGLGISATPGLTVQQAFNIDSKIDDGFPQTGSVQANFITNIDYLNPAWSVSPYGSLYGSSYTTATVGSSTSCYDNSNTPSGTPGIAGAVQHYSVEISKGSNIACGLSFKMQ